MSQSKSADKSPVTHSKDLARPPLHGYDNKGKDDDSFDSHRSPGLRRKNVSPGSPKSGRKGSPKNNVPKKGLYPVLPEFRESGNSDDDDDYDQTDDSVLIDNDGPRRSPDKNNSSRKRTGQGNNKVIQRNVKSTDHDQIEHDPKKAANNSSGNLYIFLLLLGLFLIVVGVFLYIHQDNQPSNYQQTSTPTPIDYFRMFKPGFDQMKTRYPSQSLRFWKMIGTVVKRVLNDPYPTYPGILLLAVPKSTERINSAKCFSKDFIHSVNTLFNVDTDFYIDFATLAGLTPSKAKVELDGKLKSILTNGKGVVIDHLELFPAETALLLHGYCDGDNAPYKSTVIVQILHTDLKAPNFSDQNSVRVFSDAAENMLTELWGEGLGVDEMPALRSRIANNVAVFNPVDVVKCGA